MGLSSALNTALSGLRVNQASIEIVSRNITNADTPGYTRKIADQRSVLLAGQTSVMELNSKRIVDSVLQRQIRTELAGVGYTDTRARFMSDLDSLYGAPGDSFALDTLYNKFVGSLEALTTSPESFSARQEVISGANFLTTRLNNLSGDVQRLRQEAENELQTAVDDLDSALQRLEAIDQDIASKFAAGNATADMMDVRDSVIDEIAELVDINVTSRDNGGMTVFTTSGRVLYDGTAVNLSFDGRGSVGAEALYNKDPAERNVGTVSLNTGSGYQVDLVANNSIRSGKIGALLTLRDDTLVTAQKQLDEFAAALAKAMSTVTETATPATNGLGTGVELDLANMRPGDVITVQYNDGTTNRTLSLVRVDDAAVLPLDNSVTSNPNDTVLGLDFSDGFPDAADLAALGLATGGVLDFASTGGTNLQILDNGISLDPAPATSSVTSAQGDFTKTALSDGDIGFALFVDPTAPDMSYSGSFTATSEQKTGFAARIRINPDIVKDPTLLVRYESGTFAGDSARPLAMLERLDMSGRHNFNPSSGIGSDSAPFNGNISDYLRSHIAQQTGQADVAEQAKSAQDAVFDNLRNRFSEKSGVNIDQEMAQLLSLQNAYGANARVFQTMRELFDLLTQL